MFSHKEAIEYARKKEDAYVSSSSPGCGARQTTLFGRVHHLAAPEAKSAVSDLFLLFSAFIYTAGLTQCHTCAKNVHKSAYVSDM